MAETYENDTEVIAEGTSSGALEAISRAEVDIQIKTAKAYPRSIEKFKHDAMTLATMDTETARGCFYLVPRDGKEIGGASIRFAEIIGSCWGNLQYGGRIISQDDHFLVAQGIAFDLEKNIRASVEVRRRITNRQGRKYSDDMIITTSNAAISIALRNAIFRIIPLALTKSIMDEVKKVSLGKGLTMEQRRTNAFKYFGTLGATESQVLEVVGRRGADDVDIEDLIRLNGMRTAIEDGEITWLQIYEEATKPEETPAPKTASQILKETQHGGAQDSKESGQQPPTAGGSSTPGSPPSEDKKTASGAGDESTVESFQASTDAITPDQQRMLLNSIGSARLGPKDLEALCEKHGVKQITAVNFMAYKEIMEVLVAKAAEKR